MNGVEQVPADSNERRWDNFSCQTDHVNGNSKGNGLIVKTIASYPPPRNQINGHEKLDTSTNGWVKTRLPSEESRRIAGKLNNQVDKWYEFEANLNYKPPVKSLRSGPGDDAYKVFQKLQATSISFVPTSNNIQTRRGRRPKRSTSPSQKPPNGLLAHSRLSNKSDGFTLERSASAIPRVLNKHDSQIMVARDRGDLNLLKMLPDESDHFKQIRSTPVHPRHGSQEALHLAQLSNHGSGIVDCLTNGHSTPYCQVLRAPRLRSSEALELQRRGRQGSIKDNRSDVASKPCHPRIRPDTKQLFDSLSTANQMSDCLAQKPIDQSQVKATRSSSNRDDRPRDHMNKLIGSEAISVVKPIKTKVHPRAIRTGQAERNAQMSSGQVVKQLLIDPPRLVRI